MSNPDKEIVKLKNVNDLNLAVEKYRNEVKLLELELQSGFNNLQNSFVESVQNTVYSFTRQWLLTNVMKWAQSVFNNQPKKKRKKNK